MQGQLGTQVKEGCVTACAWQPPEPGAAAAGGRSGKFREEGSRPQGRRDSGERGREARKPGAGSITWRALPAGATYLPTVWLASWRMRLNCFFIVAPRRRAGPRAWGKDGAARSPPQGYMAPSRSLRGDGDGGGTAEPPGAVWPARGGSLPRAPPLLRLLPHPPHARRGALMANARGARPIRPVRAASPQPQSGAGTREPPQAGQPAGQRGKKVFLTRLCAERRACWDL